MTHNEIPDLYTFVRKSEEQGGGFGIKPNSWKAESMFLLSGSEEALDEGRAVTVALNAWHRAEVIAERTKQEQPLENATTKV